MENMPPNDFSAEANKPYGENDLANEIYDIATKSYLGENIRLKAVLDDETKGEMKEVGLCLDYRANTVGEEESASTYEGLAFDPLRTRSQSFGIFEGETPIGTIGIVIEPKSQIKERRYIKINQNQLMIVDASSITNDDLPEFRVIPAWTEIKDSHRGKLGITGVRALTRIIEAISNKSPENTWLEVEPQGLAQSSDTKKLREEFFDLGSIISPEAIGINVENLGSVKPSSIATVKLAKLLKMREAEGVVSMRSLGPVYARRIGEDS